MFRKAFSFSSPVFYKNCCNVLISIELNYSYIEPKGIKPSISFMIPHSQHQYFSTLSNTPVDLENDALPSYVRVVKKVPETAADPDKNGKVEVDEKNPPKPVMRRSWNYCPCLKHGYILLFLSPLERSK